MTLTDLRAAAAASCRWRLRGRVVDPARLSEDDAKKARWAPDAAVVALLVAAERAEGERLLAERDVQG